MDCPRCGQAAKPGTQFCAQCGARVDTPAPQGPVYQEWAPLPVETRGDARARKLLVGCMIGAVVLALAVVGGAALLSFCVKLG